MALASKSSLFRLLEIQQTARQVLVTPHGPFGYHTTVHDAGAQDSQGIIHNKVNPGQAEVRQSPGAHRISDDKGEFGKQLIPSFQDLKGVVSLFERSGATRTRINVAALIPQLKPLRPNEARGATIVVAGSEPAMLGLDVLLVEPGSVDALNERLSLLHADTTTVFSAFVPWLAVAIHR